MGNDCIPEKKRETSGMTDEEANHEINQLELDIHLLQRTIEEKDEIIKELEGKLKNPAKEEEESEGESEGEIEWESESEEEKLTTKEIERPSVGDAEKADEIESLKNRVNILRIKIGENEERYEIKTKKLEEKLRVHICQLKKKHEESIVVMKMEHARKLGSLEEEIEEIHKGESEKTQIRRAEREEEFEKVRKLMFKRFEEKIQDLKKKHKESIEVMKIERKHENLRIRQEI